MFLNGAVIVATSNRLPEDLYAGGYQRANNAQFINMLNERCQVVHVRTTQDYRANSLSKTQFDGDGPEAVPRSYFNIVSQKDARAFVERVSKLFFGKPVYSSSVVTYGFKHHVPKAADGVAMFTFEELCGSTIMPWGSAQYLKLCSTYHTIVVQSIPQMGLLEKNEARRFITFIDAAYENKTKIVCSADSDPEDLFILSPIEGSKSSAEPSDSMMHREMIGDLLGEQQAASSSIENSPAPNQPQLDILKFAIFTAEEERFAFRRAVSRLYEMQTKDYLDAPHSPKTVPSDVELSDSTVGINNSDSGSQASSSASTATGETLAQPHAPLQGTGETFPYRQPPQNQDDFGDEASYRTMLNQYHLYGRGRKDHHYPQHHRQDTTADPADDSRPDKPRFAQKHFWGLGEWGTRAGKWGEGVRVFLNRYSGRK
eukprot:jgi/Hompol1/845/HPOL_004549-RA